MGLDDIGNSFKSHPWATIAAGAGIFTLVSSIGSWLFGGSEILSLLLGAAAAFFAIPALSKTISGWFSGSGNAPDAGINYSQGQSQARQVAEGYPSQSYPPPGMTPMPPPPRWHRGH